jgi:hypothetical protein
MNGFHHIEAVCVRESNIEKTEVIKITAYFRERVFFTAGNDFDEGVVSHERRGERVAEQIFIINN